MSDPGKAMPLAERRDELYAKIHGLEIWRAALVLFLLAIPLFYLQGNLKDPWSTIFGGLAATFAPVGLLTLIYERWLRRSAIAETAAATEFAWEAKSKDLLEGIAQVLARDLPKALSEQGERLSSTILARGWP